MNLANRLKRLEKRLPPAPLSPHIIAIARAFTPKELLRIQEALNAPGFVQLGDLLAARPPEIEDLLPRLRSLLGVDEPPEALAGLACNEPENDEDGVVKSTRQVQGANPILDIKPSKPSIPCYCPSGDRGWMS